MPTGACGINCDVCQLNLLGLCSSCGAGNSPEAAVKKEVQEKLFGKACPVLDCAVLNQNGYCIRGCRQFPCENFKENAYPFSESYLQMQERRRESPVLQVDPMGKPITVNPSLWEAVARRDLHLVAASSLSREEENQRLAFSFFNRSLVLDFQNQVLMERTAEGEQPLENPLLLLTALTYFSRVDRLYPLGKNLITTEDMVQSVYFSGQNALTKEPVIRRFLNDLKHVKAAGQALGGESLDMADAAIVVYPFSQVPVYYLFWKHQTGDERLSILFDRSIEALLPPPVIWGLVRLVNACLLCA